MLEDERLIRFDWAIRTILRDRANFDVLEGFLSALLREDVEVAAGDRKSEVQPC